MKILTKVLQLRFIPMSADLGLLLLRLWVGVAMLALHGWPKLAAFGEKAGGFMDPFGLGPQLTYTLAVIGEVGGSVLLILGLFTRLGAVLGMATMAVAFFIAHEGKLTGAGSGELAFVYLGAYAALFLLGGGRYAVDMKLPTEPVKASR
jgi:putative oxidoreductase